MLKSYIIQTIRTLAIQYLIIDYVNSVLKCRNDLSMYLLILLSAAGELGMVELRKLIETLVQTLTMFNGCTTPCNSRNE